MLIACSPKYSFSSCVLTNVTDTRFKRIVRPGDRLVYKVELSKNRGPFFWFVGEALVDGEVACSAKFSARMLQ